MSWTDVVSVALAFSILIAGLWLRQSSNLRPLPPGPPGLPFVGNIRDFKRENAYKTFIEWSNIYGDLLHLRVFSRHMLILNSLDAAVDLLEKRASIYSDRPRRVMAALSGYDKVTTFRTRYDDNLRTAKKYLHAEFSKASMAKQMALQEQAAREFGKRLQAAPDAYLDHFREITTSVTRSLFYGSDDSFEDLDGFTKLSLDVLNEFTKMAAPSQYLVDSLPFLRFIPSWFPGATFQRVAARNQSQIERFMNEPFVGVKRQIAKGIMEPCFISKLLCSKDMTPEDEEVIKWAAGAAFGAGYESTLAALTTFLQVMVIHPHVQSRAQAEIDRVTGKSRLPTFADRKSLPYVECILAEVLRWRPPIPFAWRCLREDDEYRGYHIPKGTLVSVNTKALTNNPKWYREPEEFKPERFLDADGQFSTGEAPDPRRLVFGFGRRSCPGVHMADNVMFLMVATTLASVTIAPAVGEDGELLLPDADYPVGLGGICQPPPPKCTGTVIPR